MKVLIVQVYDEAFTEIVKLCSPSVYSYCKAQNYSYSLSLHEHPADTSWGKIIETFKKLRDFDVVWSLDTDVLILNESIDIGQLLDLNADVNICGDGMGYNPWDVNAGSVIWKNSRWTYTYLEKLILQGEEKGWLGQGNWEQDFIQESLKNQCVYSHFKRHHYQLFNHSGGKLLNHFCNTRNPTDKLKAIYDFKEYRRN